MISSATDADDTSKQQKAFPGLDSEGVVTSGSSQPRLMFSRGKKKAFWRPFFPPPLLASGAAFGHHSDLWERLKGTVCKYQLFFFPSSYNTDVQISASIFSVYLTCFRHQDTSAAGWSPSQFSSKNTCLHRSELTFTPTIRILLVILFLACLLTVQLKIKPVRENP